MSGKQDIQKKKKRIKLLSGLSLLVGSIVVVIVIFLIAAVLILLNQGINQGNNTILFLSTVVGVIVSILGLFSSFIQWVRPNGTLDSSPAHDEITSVTVVSPPSSQEPFAKNTLLEGHVSRLTQIHPSIQNLSEMPQVGAFYGRSEELKMLKKWIIDDRCQVVTLLGMGGIGKTSLVATVVEQIKGSYVYISWFSLQDAPPLKLLLQEILQSFGDQPLLTLSDSIDAYLSNVLRYLQKDKSLLIVDNFESVFQEQQRAGQYREGYQDYHRFLRMISETKHQSCILITSREKPQEIAFLEGDHTPVRTLRLIGLTAVEGESILKDRGLIALDDANKRLVDYYSGNPLALKLASIYVREVFEGDTKLFLKTQGLVFGGIEELIGHQFSRISDTEKEILYWLAINREALSLVELQFYKFRKTPERDLIVAISSLRQRSMIEPGKITKFTLQPVVMEYVTELFVDILFAEIRLKSLNLFRTHALMLGNTKDYLRDSQIRLIAEPLIRLLKLDYSKPEDLLKALLTKLHEVYKLNAGYAAGNILNLLLLLKANLRGLDFSSLPIWQAYLQEADLQEVNFANARFVNTVFAHTFGSIFSVVLSADGDLMAIGTANSEIRTWQIGDGAPLLTYRGHTDWVRSIVFSPDGNILASGSEDKTVRLWNTRTGKCLQIWQGHKNRVSSVAFSPDGKILASGSEDKTIRLWKVETGECIGLLEGHENWVYSVFFSLDGELLASGSEDQTVRVWKIQTGTCQHILRGHKNRVYCVAFSPDKQYIASGSADNTIRLWNSKTGECFQELKSDATCRCLTFDRSGSLLATGSDDNVVRLWDISLDWHMRPLYGHENWVRSVAFSPDGQTLVTGSDDQMIRFWEVDTAQCFRVMKGHTYWVYAVAFSPDGKVLASGGDDQKICLWNLKSGRCEQAIDESGKIRCLIFSPSGEVIASGGDDQVIRLWEVSTGRSIQMLEGHEAWVRSVVFSTDGQLLVSSSEDKTIRLWDINTGRCLQILSDHQDWVYCVVLNTANTLLASASADQTVRIWDVETGCCLQVLYGHTNKVCSVVFSPDGKLLASSSADQTIRLWDMSSGECIRVLQGHTNWIFSLAFSPDGCRIASGSDDKTVRLWDVKTGQCTKILEGHTSWVYAVAISKDGEILASGSDDGTIIVWSLETGERLKLLRRDRPYEGMDISDATGLNDSQKEAIIALGAVGAPRAM